MAIFVSIAAYRDPELVPTVRDCLATAAHPDQLRFGICWQHGSEDPPLPFVGDPGLSCAEPGMATKPRCLLGPDGDHANVRR
jgi:Glycosyltransferase (GlcNAc)